MRLNRKHILHWLLAVAVCCALFLLALRWTQSVRVQSRIESVLSQAQAIHTTVFRSMAAEGVFAASSTSRGGHAVGTSTEYFRWLVASNIVNVGFSFFAAPGVPPYLGSDPVCFLPENNAWCVTADLASSSDGSIPLMFTRNLGIESLTNADASKLRDGPPFGKRGVVVLYKNGNASFLRAEELGEAFNPSGATNVVLRPK